MADSPLNLCSICPRNCKAERGETLDSPAKNGFCRCARKPVLARAALHFWEEPCISGKRGSGAVFFSGCNLRCVFCQNYEISTGRQGKEISVERLRQIYFELIKQGAHNINLVTPSHFADAIDESLRKPLPVPVVWNSNGYDSVETLRRFEGRVKIFLPDMKYSDAMAAAKYSSAPDYVTVARKAVLEMFRQTGPYQLDSDGMLKQGVIIRHLILPGNVENSLGVIDWVTDHFQPGDVMFSLMRQYLPHGRAELFPELTRRVTDEEYERVENYLYGTGFEDGFVQEADSAEEEFIPAFDGTGVEAKS